MKYRLLCCVKYRLLCCRKRSSELNLIAAYYDTYAHLLYRLKLYAEAENAQQKAVELIKAEKKDSKQAQGELVKIKISHRNKQQIMTV